VCVRITINPNNVSDIWIVDSGTAKVYQYTAAVGLPSGSQNAAATFDLATGNTNPQGIADPTPFLGQATVAAQPTSVGQPILAASIASLPLRSPTDWLFGNQALVSYPERKYTS
jgi:hypothetical protein